MYQHVKISLYSKDCHYFDHLQVLKCVLGSHETISPKQSVQPMCPLSKMENGYDSFFIVSRLRGKYGTTLSFLYKVKFQGLIFRIWLTSAQRSHNFKHNAQSRVSTEILHTVSTVPRLLGFL